MIYGAPLGSAVISAVMTKRGSQIGTSQEARAERLILLYAALGMTRTQFATSIGMSPQTVYNWEKTQNVSTEGALAILRTHNVSTDWLLAGLEHKLDREVAEKIQAARTAQTKSSA